MTELRGARVRLRPLSPEDLEPLWRVRLADEGTSDRTPDARERLRERLGRASTLEDDGWLELGIEVEGVLVGDVQARAPKRAIPPGVCEIGVSLLPEARGRGYGTEAVRLFTDRLFRDGLARVQASTAVDNVAMRRVLERLGYAYEGALRAFMPTEDNRREDYALYAVTRADWEAREG